MLIEWVPILSAALKGGATGGTAKAAGWLAEKVKGKVFPGELKLALDKAMDAAQKRDVSLAANQHLFYRCDDKQQRDFLGKVLEASLLLEELQKPIENNGSIDQAILQLLFQQVASELKMDLVAESLPGWISAFADTYFEQTTATIRFQAAKGKYLESLARRVDDVKFVGIDVPGEEVEKQGQLVKIFVMPDVRSEGRYSSFMVGSYQSGQKLLNLMVEDSVPFQVNAQLSDVFGSAYPVEYRSRMIAERFRSEQEIVTRIISAYQVFSNQQSQSKVVLLGVPGSGKSTLVNFFALKICHGQANQVGLDDKRDWLPIVIRMRDWILQPQQSLLDYCRLFVENNLWAGVGKLPPGFFEHWLELGQALILLDGLDEVSNETQRKEIAEKIESFVGIYQQNPVLITSRPIGYRRDFFDEQKFTHYVLEEFDRPKIEAFIENWYSSRVDNPEEAEQRKTDLRSALDRKGQILQLAKNPLLITVIALIHRYQADLPRQRHLLYEKAVSTLLTTWNKGHTPDSLLKSDILKPNDWLYIMRKVAYHLHSMEVAHDADGGTLIAKDDLIAEISQVIKSLRSCSLHDAQEEARCFVQFIRERTGLLNEQGRDQYGFVHKTFQEYLTAAEIYSRFEDGDDDIVLTMIKTHLHQPHWREVLLLLVGMLKGQRAAKAIRAVLNANSEYEQWLHRDLLFAAWCLTEDPQGLKQGNQELVHEILQNIFDIEIAGKEKIGKSTILEISEIFRNLVETNFQNDALELLDNYSSLIDSSTAIELRYSLGQTQEAIIALIYLLKDPEDFVHGGAVRILGQLGSESEQVIAALLSFLTDPEVFVRGGVVRALGRSGNASQQIITALLPLLTDPILFVRASTIKALGQLGSNSQQIITALLSLLKDPEQQIRTTTVESLGQLGSNSQQVITALLPLLKDPEEFVRSATALVLGQVGTNSDQVIIALLSLLKDPEDLVRSRAARALGRLQSDSETIITSVLPLLQDPDDSVRGRAASILGQLGNNSETVIIALLPLLKDPEIFVRIRVAETLCKLDHSSEQVTTILLSLLTDLDDFLRIRAAEALGKSGNSSEQIITALIHLLKDPEFLVRDCAAKVLGQLGNSSEQVITALISLLTDPMFFISASAAEALNQLENSSQQIVLPKLGKWFKQHQNFDTKGSAIDLLKRLVDQSAGVD
jgi:HEAT repeat protein